MLDSLLAGRALCTGGVWRNELLGTLFTVSDTQSCHLPLIYALKGLESECKASNFTFENALGISLFVFLSLWWEERIYVTMF